MLRSIYFFYFPKINGCLKYVWLIVQQEHGDGKQCFSIHYCDMFFIYDILFSRLWKMKVTVLNYVKSSGVIFNSSNAIFCQKRYTYWQFIHLRVSIIKVLLLKVLYANGSQNYLNIFYKEIHSIWKFWLIEVCRAYVEHNKLYMELFFSLSMKNLLERMKLKKRKT